METINNKAAIKEALERRTAARKEAIRRTEEAHERFERVMIRTVNEHAANAKKRDSLQYIEFKGNEVPARREEADEHKKAAVNHKELAKFMAEGDDYLLKMWLCVGAVVVTSVLNSIGVMLTGTAVVIYVLLAAFFAYIVHELYEIAGAIAECM